MKPLLVATVALSLALLGGCFNFNPPARSEQGQAFTNFELLQSSSDRIVLAVLNSSAQEVLEVEEGDPPRSARYLAFQVRVSYKGSANMGDEIFVIDEEFAAFGNGRKRRITVQTPQSSAIFGRINI